VIEIWIDPDASLRVEHDLPEGGIRCGLAQGIQPRNPLLALCRREVPRRRAGVEAIPRGIGEFAQRVLDTPACGCETGGK
jgi:hypothetical protein